MGAGASAIAATTGVGDADAKLRAAVAVKLHVADATGAIGSDATNRARIEGAFRQADGDGDGRMGYDEFAAAAHSIGLGVADADLRRTFARFDTDGDHSISLEEVVAFLFPASARKEDIVAQQQLARMAAAATGTDSLSEATSDVYSAVKKIAGRVFEKEIILRKAFKKWDRDNNGHLDRNELTQVLNELGFSVNGNEVDILYNAFDLDGDGRISCWELVKGIGSLTPEIRLDEAQLEQQRLRREHEGREAAAAVAEAERRAAEERRKREEEAAAAERAAAEAAAMRAREAAVAEEEARRSAAERAAAAAAQRAAAKAAASRRNGTLAKTVGFITRLRTAVKHRRAEQASAAAMAKAAAERAAAEEAARRAAEAAAAAAAARAAADAARLVRFAEPTSATELREMSAFAWKLSPLDAKLSDVQIIDALRKRLDYVRVDPADALSQCTRDPDVCDAAHDRYGVDGATLVAFAAQLNLGLAEDRASRLLHNARGPAGLPPDGGIVPEDADVLPVPDFLRLFSADAAGGGAGRRKGGGHATLQPNKVEALTEHERRLLSDLRESLFERHANMKSMFERMDSDGSGVVSVEEFLKAMERAGSVAVAGKRVGHEIDRGAAEISEEEACNIVGFFDRDGSGGLSYAEFMVVLQDSRHMALDGGA